MVGVRDVAKHAGVSIGTVSSVISGHGMVSAASAEKVRKAMRDLDYVPNELARNLFRNETNQVGVIVPSVSHPFFAALLERLEERLFEAGLRTMVCSTDKQERGESEYVDMLKRRMMDCIIMCSHTIHPTDYWESIDRPVVAFDRFLGERIPVVGSDHTQGGRLAAEHLLRTGARHVVQIGTTEAELDESRRLGMLASGTFSFLPIRHYAAFTDTLRAQGARVDNRYFADGRTAYETAVNTAESVLREYPDADGFIAPDMVAAVFLQRAMAAGRRVPEDMQIIAYDGTTLSLCAGLPMTAVVQDLDAITNRLVEETLVSTGRSAPRCANEDDPNVISSGSPIPVSIRQGGTTRHPEYVK